MHERSSRAVAVAEREVKVAKNQNVLVVRAKSHTWVALVADGHEVVRDLGAGEETTFGVERGTYAVQTDGKLVSVQARAVELPSFGSGELAVLQLTSDAKDQHPVDGVPEIVADGKSFSTITVAKLGADGRPLTRRADNDQVFLRTTGGSLVDAAGKAVRSVKLSAGKATFRIVSEPAGRLVTIEAIGQPPLAGASLRLEFV